MASLPPAGEDAWLAPHEWDALAAPKKIVVPTAADRMRVLRYMIAMFECELALLEVYGDPGPYHGHRDHVRWENFLEKMGDRG